MTLDVGDMKELVIVMLQLDPRCGAGTLNSHTRDLRVKPTLTRVWRIAYQGWMSLLGLRAGSARPLLGICPLMIIKLI